MNETPQPPSSEEPKQQPPIHSSKEAPKQPSPASDAQSDEAELETVRYTPENNPWKPASSPESSSDELPTQVWSDTSAESQSELPTQVWSDTSAESQSESPTQVWSDTSTSDQVEPATQSWSDTSAASTDGQAEPAAQSWSDTSTPSKDDEYEGEGDAEDDDEDDEDEDAQAVRSSSQSGVFIHKGILFAAAGVIVAAAIVVALLLFLNRPIDPPTEWFASITPPVTAGAPSTGTTLYYLHWTNKNGALTGQLQLAANNGTPQTLNAPTTGLYSRDNHVIFVVVTINGQAVTLTGKINDSNDILTLNQPGAPDLTSQIVFHKGSADEYKQATNKLNAKK
jgi:hypothetical protein